MAAPSWRLTSSLPAQQAEVVDPTVVEPNWKVEQSSPHVDW
jgi:hypothetical protein